MPDLLAAIAEPNRRRLLQLLANGEQTVNELASGFSVSRSAISQHLLLLADVGLVTSRQEGRFRFYRLDPNGLAALRGELAEFWTHELDLLVAEAQPAATRPTSERS